jgi:acyl-CoA dehydrogenase
MKFTSEHNLFRESLRSYLVKNILPNLPTWEKQGRIPATVWTEMGEMGFLGLNYPEQYGGIDVDFFYSVIFLEELGRLGYGGFAAALGVHQYVSVAHIAALGSDYLKAEYLSKAISGEKIGALAISEPAAGSNVAGLTMTAKREGDFYVLNGSKTFITNGVYADFIVTACQTETGLSLIVVDGNSEGLTRAPLEKMGWHCSDTGELAFQEVKVPAKNIIAEEGQGFYHIMTCFQLERLIMAIMAVAGMEECIAITMKYMQEREAFGKPISKYQVLRHKIADLVTELEVAKVFTYHTCEMHANGEFAVKECSMAKLFTTELAKKLIDECLQMFGGYGYMESFPLARMYRDARVGTIAGGTSEIMKEIIAKIVFDEAKYKN